MRENYTVTIKESSKELTSRERIKMKDLTGAHTLDKELDENNDIRIQVQGYAILAVHNENSENVDYEIYVLEDTNGERYYTGSESMFDTFKDIWDEIHLEEDTFELSIYKRASTNRQGKYFLTCSLV